LNNTAAGVAQLAKCILLYAQ